MSHIAALRKYFSALCLVLLGYWSMANMPEANLERITGRIVDEKGTPVEGVTIQVKGATATAISDASGQFIINAPGDATLVISHIGFETTEIQVNNQEILSIQLRTAASTTQEVVVVGYGTQKKVSLTGSVYVVKMPEIREQAVASGNIVKALDSRVPGVTTGFNGNPNNAASMLIRGRGSLNSSNDPLIIIDGVPTNRGLNELAANDIESVQVLKDASAATIYGSRAANGVLIVTTKSAKKGPRLEVNSAFTVGFLAENSIPLLTTEEYGRAQWMAARNDKVDPNYGVYSFEDHQDANGNWVLDRIILPEYLDDAKTMRPANTNWQDVISRDAVSQNHNVTVSNGSENASYLLGVDHLRSLGTTKYNQWTRTSVRLNSSFKLFDGRLQLGENFSVIKMRYTGGSWLPNTVNIQSIVPVRTEDGIGWGGPVRGMSDRNNPLLDIMRNRQNHTDDLRLLGSAFADLEIIKNLHFRSTFGVDYDGFWTNQSVLTYQAGFMSETLPKLTTSANYGGSWTWNNVLTYRFNVKSNNFQLMVGQEATEGTGADIFGARDGFADESPDYMYLNVGEGNVRNGGLAWDNALNSYFGRINYDFDNKYLLTAIIRRDGSSRFGASNRYATFPSLSVGWAISEENFMKNIGWLSNLKIRYGWGQTGNQAIDNYASYQQYQARYGDNDWPFTTGTAYDIFGQDEGNLQSGYSRLQLGNPDLKWETTTQNNVGVDFAFFQSKLTGSLDFYKKTTTDILVKPPTLLVTGTGAGRWINGATMNNRGWELVLSYADRIGNVDYTLSGNVYRNRNEFTYIVPEAVGGYAGNGRDQTILGRPLNSLYGYVVLGIFQNQEQVDAAPVQPGKGVGRLQYQDIGGPDGKPDGKIDADDRTWIGVSDPKLSFGFNSQFRWKNFDFAMFWHSEIGREIGSPTKGYTDFFGFFGGQNYGKRVLESWSPTNTSSTIPAITAANINQENRFSTYFVENTSFLKLRSLVLGYNLPESLPKRIKMRSARVFLQGENIWNIDLPGNTFTGFDPKSWDTNFPLPTSVTLGLNLIF